MLVTPRRLHTLALASFLLIVSLAHCGLWGGSPCYEKSCECPSIHCGDSPKSPAPATTDGPPRDPSACASDAGCTDGAPKEADGAASDGGAPDGADASSDDDAGDAGGDDAQSDAQADAPG